jgi:hypothetical protein
MTYLHVMNSLRFCGNCDDERGSDDGVVARGFAVY